MIGSPTHLPSENPSVNGCSLQSAHQRRDVPASPTEDAFKEVINKAEIAVKEAGEHISKMLGLDQNAPTGDQVVELIKNQTKAFTVQAEAVQRQLENEVSPREDDEDVGGYSVSCCCS